MSTFDNLAKQILDDLKRESERAGSIIKHMAELGGAREALIRDVLQRILSNRFEISKGEIKDVDGKPSKQMDVIVALRDSPCERFASGYNVYRVESVLATIEVKSDLKGKNLTEALDNCASVGMLEPRVDRKSYEELLAAKGVSRSEDGILYHPNQLELERFGVILRPATYVFGFTGYSTNLEALKTAIQRWGDNRVASGKPLNMYHLPAVVASDQCFALRNAEPYHKPTGQRTLDCFLYVGREETPLRLLIAHLLYAIQTRIPWVPDAGSSPRSPFIYMPKMESFNYEGTVFCSEEEAARSEEEGVPVRKLEEKQKARRKKR